MLVVFGPLYRLRTSIPCIVGFAQPWIIYPDNEIASAMSRLARWRTRLKFAVQSLFFRKADLLLVELEHVRRRLDTLGIAAESRVSVVRNCLSAIYGDPARWQQAPQLAPTGGFRLGFVGRDYAHKNTRIFPGSARHSQA